MLNCALALRLQHRFRHFLDEQRNAVSTLDDVLADVGWQRLVADDALDQGENFAFSQPVNGESRNVRPSDPGRLELWPERHDQQHAEARYPVNNPTEQFEAGGVGPMRILEDHQNCILPSQSFQLGNERGPRSLSTLLGGQIVFWIASVIRQ